MKKVCMISTGGTIASEAGADGLRPQVTAEKMMAMLPEAAALCHVDYEEILQLDSSNLLPEHWQLMARTVARHYAEYDGFVISHGTDTMAYSAAALSYMLQNLGKPVVFTGSQLPIEHPQTDGRRNLLLAFQAAVSGHPGVFLAFDGHLLPGRSAKKLYTENFRAFYSINAEEAGIFEAGQISWKQLPQQPAGNFYLADAIDPKVCVLKLIPGMDPSLLTLLADAGYHAIIIEGYGAGGVPTAASPKNFLPAMEDVIKRGVLVVCATQCLYDGVHLDCYEMGVLARRLGAISSERLTLEALVPKLMLTLAKTRDAEEVRRQIEREEG